MPCGCCFGASHIRGMGCVLAGADLGGVNSAARITEWKHLNISISWRGTTVIPATPRANVILHFRTATLGRRSKGSIVAKAARESSAMAGWEPPSENAEDEFLVSPPQFCFCLGLRTCYPTACRSVAPSFLAALLPCVPCYLAILLSCHRARELLLSCSLVFGLLYPLLLLSCSRALCPASLSRPHTVGMRPLPWASHHLVAFSKMHTSPKSTTRCYIFPVHRCLSPWQAGESADGYCDLIGRNGKILSAVDEFEPGQNYREDRAPPAYVAPPNK